MPVSAVVIIVMSCLLSEKSVVFFIGIHFNLRDFNCSGNNIRLKAIITLYYQHYLVFVKRHLPLHAVHSLLWTATVLESLFRECHLSSATLGQKHPEVTKHPLGHTWSEAPAVGINHCLTQNTNKSCSCRVKILTMERL